MGGDRQIDEEGLNRLVTQFYARVREDAELGPIFNNAIADWPEHLEKLAAFWSSVMLTSGRYKGQPVPAHLKHKSRITPALFERWLMLWAETTSEMMSPEAAAALQAKAKRIAESLQLAMFFRLDRQGAEGSATNSDTMDYPRRRVRSYA
ncbi:group III truncated hemoglobin [Sphingobium cupriresistens]|uniref:Group III truncated hemoglobin n=1 Tax=Sphingobium cupriresistens TaxID=1132417 RepID=A0A8G2DWK8_9SPHN|nr:group III truncated hemoglobin [Sphingobium cupriresistens]RYM10741.1 group III truncated hemoglobin [Sphingobium cupriresistens]